MYKILILDSQISGIAGDLFLSSLVDCGANKNLVIKNIKKIEKYFDGSQIKKIDFVNTDSNGIRAKKIVLEIVESKTERNALEMVRIINLCCENSNLSDEAKNFVLGSIKTIIEVESKIHNKDPRDLHLHESSSIDTGVDLIGTASALDNLKLFESTKIYSTKVAVGGGFTEFSHGIVSNPANAILEIFRRFEIPIIGGPVNSELTTPTGAAILVNLNPIIMSQYPEIIPRKIGYGTGTKSFSGISNILKTTIGNPFFDSKTLIDKVSILETNLDDTSGELIGHLIENISTIHGVKDITVLNGVSKKNRPSFIIKVICSEEVEKKIADMLFIETGTLGVRKTTSERYILERSTIQIPIMIEGKKFLVSTKISNDSFGKIIHAKPEFEDVKHIASQMDYSLKKTLNLVNNLISQQNIKKISDVK